MKKGTEENLKAAFAGESQAHMKYLAFADRAERDGMANIARLFRAASFAEQAHATAHLRVLSGVGTTAQNLAAAIAGETYEFEEMYPAFESVARMEEEKAAVRSIERAMDAEKVHAQLYARARDAAEGGQDAAITAVVVCASCGYTAEGDAPDKCPLCGAPRERFRQF